jgi:hypothetical protein
MNFKEWIKQNPGRSVNDYYMEHYGVKEEDLPQQQSVSQGEKKVHSENHYHFYSDAGVSVPERPYYFDWITVTASVIGLAAYYVPFISFNLSSRVARDLNIGILGKLVELAIPTRVSNFEIQLANVRKTFYGMDYNELHKIEQFIWAQQTILACNIFCFFLGWHLIRKTINLLYVSGAWTTIIVCMCVANRDFTFEIGIFMMFFVSMVFVADIFTPAPNLVH